MIKPELFAEAIARSWIDNAPLSPWAIDQLAPGLFHTLRKLESSSAADAEPVEVEIFSLLQPFPQFEERVRDEINVLHILDSRDSAPPAVDVARRVKYYRHSLIEVAYATDRRSLETSDIRGRYGHDRGELSFGIAQVSIPDDHRMGRLEKPRVWTLGFREDRRRHLEIAGLMPTNENASIPRLANIVQRAPEPEILVFVHGYNVSFVDAVCRAAQIAYDLDFKGTPFLYSWPSDASALRYFVDGENAQWSQQNFRIFLDYALANIGCTRVHVLAHSMGNRIVTEALTSMDFAALPVGSAQLGQIVFAAPDIDTDIFIQRARKFIGRADRYTLYVSDRDQALNISKRIAKYPRAGQAGSNIVVLDGIDTIDVSSLDTGLMSHSYIGNHRSVTSDLYYLIHHDNLPSDRFGLNPVVTSAGVYWTFRQ